MLTTLLNILPLAVSVKDALGRYQLVNATFQSWFGVQADTVIGRTDEECFEGDLLRWLQTVGRDRAGLKSESSMRVGARTLRARCAAANADESESVVTVFEAESSPVLNEDAMLSAIAHDLRTPLNAMTGWLHLLDQAKEPGPLRDKACSGLSRAVQQQGALIEELGETLQASRGELVLEARHTDLSHIVEKALMRDATTRQQDTLRTEVRGATSALPVFADDRRIESVIRSFITAVRRSAGPRATLVLGTARHESCARLTMTVLESTGDPMPLGDLFPLPGSTRSRRRLPLRQLRASELIRVHGGSITLAPSQDVVDGLLVVDLPLDNYTERPTPAASRLVGLRVLLADDQFEMRDVLTTLLEQQGCKVVATVSAAEAFNTASAASSNGHAFDVAVFDIAMPDEDGVSLIKRLRRWESTNTSRHLPAVAFTAHGEHWVKEAAIQAGFERLVVKSAFPGTLFDTIAELAGR